MLEFVLTAVPMGALMLLGFMIAETGFRGLRPTETNKPASLVSLLLRRLMSHLPGQTEATVLRLESIFWLSFGSMLVIGGVMSLNLMLN